MCGCDATFQCKRHQRDGIWAAEEWDELFLADPRFEDLVDRDQARGVGFAKPTEGDA